MNQSRARLIMLLNITFCVVVAIPYFAASERLNSLFTFGLNIFHTTSILLTYVAYIKTYFSIRRQTAALYIGKGEKVPLHNKRDKRRECQNRISTTEQYSFEVESRTCAVSDPMKDSHRPKPFSISKDTIVLQPQSNAFVLPAYSATSQKLLFANEERRDEVSKSVTLSRVLENGATSLVTQGRIQGEI